MRAMADPAIGAKIRRQRQVLGMTQKELAAELGVSKSTVANWERGKHFPLRYAGAIEHVLGIELDVTGPRLSPRVQRIVDEMTPGEKALLVAYLTQTPPPPADGPGRRHEAG